MTDFGRQNTRTHLCIWDRKDGWIDVIQQSPMNLYGYKNREHFGNTIDALGSRLSNQRAIEIYSSEISEFEDMTFYRFGKSIET